MTENNKSDRYASLHARDRFEQRYGRRAPWTAWRDAVAAIAGGKGALLLANNENDRRQVWLVIVDGTQVEVVFAPEKRIVTVLTKGMKRRVRMLRRGSA